MSGWSKTTWRSKRPGRRRAGARRSGGVSGGDDDDVRIRVEPVHLDEDLVERLLALVVAAAESGAAVAAYCVDLVNEDDTGRIALRLVEQVAHTPGLAGHRLREQRLSSTGGPYQKDALGNASTQRGELLGVLQKLNNFLQLFFGLVHTGHVKERYARPGAAEHTGAALAEVERLVVRSLSLPQEEEDNGEDDDDREEVDEEGEIVGPRAGLLDYNLRLVLYRHVLVLEEGRDGRVRRQGCHVYGVVSLDLVIELTAVDIDLFDLSGLDLGYELPNILLDLARVASPEDGKNDGYDGHQDQEINKTIPQPASVHNTLPRNTVGQARGPPVRL